MLKTNIKEEDIKEENTNVFIINLCNILTDEDCKKIMDILNEEG